MTVPATDGNIKVWSPLPVYEAGKQITYSVEETLPTGSEYTKSGDDTTLPAVKDDSGKVEITNSYTPETTKVTATKTWDDAENQDGKRSESITLTLNGKYTVDEAEKTVTIDGASAEITPNDQGEWPEKVWEDLPKYQEGQMVTYTVTEEKVAEYDTTYEPASASGEDGTITITNKYEPEETAVTVTKIWDDDNDAGKVRPESIKVTLMANGESAAEQEITAEDGWAFTFDKLPVYADGKKITYTVKEKAVANYDAPVITGNTETGFKIRNPRVTPPDPYDYVFTFTKRWAGTPGDSINWKSYTLDGKEARLKGFKKTVVSKNEWRYEKWFKAMPDYYIIEDVPAGYTVRYQNVGKYADVTDRCYNGGTIINYPVPKTGDDANPILWIGCILASLTLLGGIGFIAKRRKHS